ncbi:MAG TPA: glycosyltransferase, partial [Gemmatimonadaceae bacterium]
MPERALVVVPTYNERENIARIISAVLGQDARLEMLIVDDGSPDGTAGIVNGIIAADSRVHILEREKKMGLGTA